MTSLFDKWGLSPQERRLVVIVGIVVFVVINIWVIIPMFGDWGRYEQRIREARSLRDKYNAEIGRQREYETRLKSLQQQGSQVASEEAALRLQQEVIGQANLTGLGYGTIANINRSSSSGKTNAFFDEAGVTVTVNTGEKELIDFLVRLADKEMLIRAKSMDIGPDPSGTRLQGNLTLVKSFQRKPPPRAAAAARPTTAAATPASKPAATPAGGAGAATAPKSDAPKPVSRLPGAAAATAPTNASSGRALPKPLQ